MCSTRSLPFLVFDLRFPQSRLGSLPCVIRLDSSTEDALQENEKISFAYKY